MNTNTLLTTSDEIISSVILYDKYGELSVYFRVEEMYRFVTETNYIKIYEILNVFKHYSYYNSRFIEDEKCMLKYLICRIINCRKDVVDKRYNILYNEYILKKTMDTCLKEIKLYIDSKHRVREFYKNDMLWMINHIMFMNIDMAKRFGYEFLPTGFADTS